jgi:hypothetical protein
MQIEETRGRFGFHLKSGRDEPHATTAFVQFYVKSSALSRVADLAISPHLMTEAEIDAFIDEAVSVLQEIRMHAKCALAEARPA